MPDETMQSPPVRVPVLVRGYGGKPGRLFAVGESDKKTVTVENASADAKLKWRREEVFEYNDEAFSRLLVAHERKDAAELEHLWMSCIPYAGQGD